jgi:hypothetical protein
MLYSLPYIRARVREGTNLDDKRKEKRRKMLQIYLPFYLLAILFYKPLGYKKYITSKSDKRNNVSKLLSCLLYVSSDQR